MCQSSGAEDEAALWPRQAGFWSEKRYRRRGAWLPRIARRGVRATCVCVAASLALCGAAGAQPSDNPLGDLLKPREAEARLPSADEAMEAYRAVEGWVREWSDPGPAPFPASAVRVGLYQRGRLIGWGQSQSTGGGERGPLAVASGAAMAGAAHFLLPTPDALAAEQLRAEGAALTVSVELAGALTPLGETELANPDAVIRPGLDGLAVRVQGEWLLAFPSEILAGGAAAGVRLPAMAAKLLGEAELGLELPIDLAREHGAAFYRFETMHVAGVGPGGSAVFVHRGGSVVETGEVTTDGLVGFAEAMLAHFEATLIGGDAGLGLMGPLDAATGVANPPIATPMQQSLAALALVRLSETARVPGPVRERARTLARSVMADLAVLEPVEVEVERDGVAAAVAWVVLDELGTGADEPLAGLAARCEEMLGAHAAAERDAPVAGVSEAVLVWALAERAARTGRDGEVAERDLRSLYRVARPGEVVGLMPWLGWAELRLAGDGPVPSRDALRRVREQVWEHQLSALDTGLAERDMAGGVVFTRGFVSLPTWSTARPVALCATMLGDGRLTTGGEASGEVVRLIGAMRFLRQLSARETECALYPRADLARGGVRAAVWDQRMPPEATAMTMLAVCEFLRSVDGLEERAREAAGPGSR